jgi:glyoxylase-like metal-dependent hydrolase (beta-lactamase superfamily II)
MAGNNILLIGNVEIMALIDAEAKAPCAMLFPAVTPEQWSAHSEYLVDDCRNMQLTIPTFVVRSGGKTIVIDTGIGAKNRTAYPNGRLPDALAEAGVRPEDVDVVMATHIHIDHVGWHTVAEGDGFIPLFPNATYVFHRPEYEFFTQDPEASKLPWVPDCILPLEGKVEISLVDGEHHLTDDLTLMPTPGHTPGHVAISIMSGGESAVLIGDVCHNPAQLIECTWSPVFDMNPVLAAETRAALAQKIEDEQLITIAGHFPYPGFGRLVRVEGRRSWVTL